MPVMAAGANSILFGDLSKFKVRRVKGDLSVTRLVERYAEYAQVGFIGFQRADSNLIDAGTHPGFDYSIKKLPNYKIPYTPAGASFANFCFSTPWLITIARSRPTAFIAVTRR